MKIVSIVGARPQFIKAAPVIKALREANHQNFLIHTGQHYDYGMSRVFFEELGIPEPDVNLGVGSGTHGWQTGEMLIRIEEILLKENADCVLVYGDTNTTLAGALSVVKLRIPLAHVEAGLRSFNREMPEEHNRILTDHCSDLLFCPTETAVKNLEKESFANIVNEGKLITSPHSLSLTPYSSPLALNVGDTMYDAILQFTEIAYQYSTILKDLGLEPKTYLVATVHRPYNTDIPEKLHDILAAFLEIGEPIIFPVHPRTRKKISELNDKLNISTGASNVKMIDPIGYKDMLILEQNARMILTDSGGMQKEAYFFGVPCITLRPETEWTETVGAGWNVLTGADTERIVKSVRSVWPLKDRPAIYGDGRAANKIVTLLDERY